MIRNNVLYSPKVSELRKKKRQILLRKIGIFSFLFIILVVSLSFLSRIKKINIDIQNIEVSGNNVIDTEEVQKIAKRDLSGKYLFLFPRTNYFISPERKIKIDLLENFKRFSNVELSVKDARLLSIKVVEREGKYLWCGENPPVSNEEGVCYFLDESGFIFDKAPFFSNGVYFKYYGTLGEDVFEPIGNYFLPQNFRKTVSLNQLLISMKLSPLYFFQNESGYMNIVLPNGAKIIFKPDADFEKLAENLEALFSTEPFKTDFVKKYTSLLYIDLRFGNKVYYKFNE